MDVSGKLKVMSNEVQVNEKFRKREFVIEETSSQYPQFIQFQLTQDRCSLIDSFKLGDDIKVHFNLRGREWKSPSGEVKYFNTLEAWRLERQGNNTNTQYGGGNEGSNFGGGESQGGGFASLAASPNDDLPF